MSTPVESSNPAFWASLGRDVHVPVEDLRPARGGAHPRVQLEARPEPRAQRAQRRGQRAEADLAVVLEARRGRARHDPQLEGAARGPRAEHDRVVVYRHQALAAAHLLGGDVGEQVAAHRALVVGGEALALARDRDRDEVQRVELGVGVLQRGAGGLALVDDQLPGSAPALRAAASARAIPPPRRTARPRRAAPARCGAAASGRSPRGRRRPGWSRRGRARRCAATRAAGRGAPAARRRGSRPRRRPPRAPAPGRGSGRPACASRARPGLRPRAGRPTSPAGCGPRGPRRRGSPRGSRPDRRLRRRSRSRRCPSRAGARRGPGPGSPAVR